MAWNQVRLADVMPTKDVANEDRDRMFAEIRVLKALKHKNIMSFCDSWLDAKTHTINFITELFTSGTLRQYRKRHKHVDSEVLKRWAWQILCGLVYLHGHNPPIIHRDLKCDNIFINGSDGVVKIGDLGLATMLRSRTAPQSVLGTPEFMAPELYEEEYDDRVDVYSFGMALLELATLEYPYSECTNAAQIYRKVSLGVRPQGLQKVTSRDLAEFINTCIAGRAQRPRARQLLKHPYFDSVRQTLMPCKSEMSLVAAAAAGVAIPAPIDHLNASGNTRTSGSAAAVPTAVAPGDYIEGGGEVGMPTTTTTTSGSAIQSGGGGGPPSVASSASEEPMLPSKSTTPGAPAYSAVAATAIAPSMATTTTTTTAAEAAGTMTTAPDGSSPPLLHGGGGDAASVQSQRSNASELAAVLVGLEKGSASGRIGVDSRSSNTADAGSRMGSRTTSRNPSPPDSPFNKGPTTAAAGGSSAYSSPLPVASPQGSDVDESLSNCRCAATERCFQVMGKVRADEADRDKTLLNLRLRIKEPDGSNRTVEFEFDLTHDTVGSVASEMVSDLELSPEDADTITAAMKWEISKLSANMEGAASVNLESAAAALQAGLMENALLQANSLAEQMEENEEGGDDGGGGGVDDDVKVDSRAIGGSGGPLLGGSDDERWQEAVEGHRPPSTLPSNCSASSLVSEASVASAHSLQSVQSAQSVQSIQSSPAQLGLPSDASSSRQHTTPGPPTLSGMQRLTRTTSVDRHYKSMAGQQGM